MSQDINLEMKMDIGQIKESLNTIISLFQGFTAQIKEPIAPVIDSKGLEESIKNIEVTVTQGVQKVQEGVKNSTHNMIQSIGAVGMAWSALSSAFNKFNGEIASLVSASNIQEKALSNLESALKQINQNTTENIKSYQDLASEIQKTTVIGDEQTLSLVTMSVNMGIANQKRQEAVKGAIGLAKSFESLGLSQETAMKGIALAYEGNFSALQRYIPALQSAGSEAEKMAILHEEMVKGFQMAKDEINTNAGAMQQYKNLIGDLKEYIGELLVGAIMPFIKRMTEIASFLNDHPKLFKALIIVLTTLASTIALLVLVMMKKHLLMIKDGVITAAHILKEAHLTLVYGIRVGVLKLVTGAMAIYTIITGAATKVVGSATLATKAMTLAQLKLNIAMSANPVGAIIAAFTALFAIVTAATYGIAKLGETIGIWGNKNKSTESTVKLVDVDALYAEKELIRDHVAENEEIIINGAKRERKELEESLEKKLISEQEYYAKLREINQKEKDDLFGIQKANHEHEIALIEKKISVGKATQADLKIVVEKYYEWAKEKYGEDTEEYLNALQKKLDLEKDHQEKLKKLQEELVSYQNSQRDQKQVVTDNYNEQLAKQKEFLDNKLINQSVYQNNILKLQEQHEKDLAYIELQKQKDDLALAERKLQLEIYSNKEFQEQFDKYEKYILDSYDKEADAYLTMLEKKQAYQKKMNDDDKRDKDRIKQENADLLKSIEDKWNENTKKYNFKIIDIKTLESARDKTIQALKEMDIPADELKIKIQEINNEFRNLANSQYDIAIKSLENLSNAGKVAATAIKSIEDSMSSILSQMIVENKKFADIMMSLWKNLASIIINEISRIIARMMILKSLQAIGLPIPAFASGGYVAGSGSGTSDSINFLLYYTLLSL